MESTDILSCREIRRRLRAVHEATIHLNPRMPLEHTENRHIRLPDIARHVGCALQWLLFKRLEEPPPKCAFNCPTVNECRKPRKCREIEPALQRSLSDFFKAWDAGKLGKVRVGNEWRIVHSVGFSGPVQTRPPIACQIDVTMAGPVLRIR